MVEQKVVDVETRSLVNQSQGTKDHEYVDIHFSQMQTTLMNVNHRLQDVEAITKNWDKMQQELILLNSEVAVIRSTQTGLHTLMEGLAKQMESSGGSGSTQEETFGEDWRVSGQLQV